MSPFQEGLWLYWRQKVITRHINKEMCTVSVAFPLFCPTPIYGRIFLHLLPCSEWNWWWEMPLSQPKWLATSWWGDLFYFLIYIVYLRRYCDGEKDILIILMNLHVFSTPEYKTAAYMRKYCGGEQNWSHDFDGFTHLQQPWMPKSGFWSIQMCTKELG
jgi:hypothetical protein